MRLTILGATGKTGRIVLNKAIEQGHLVTALVRNPQGLPAGVNDVQIVRGSAEDLQSIRDAISGADAVVSAVGSGNGTLEALATNLVNASDNSSSQRFVSLIGAGVSEPGDPSSLGRAIMLGLMRLVARDVLTDAERHASIIRVSDLKWTLVRPPRLTNGRETGNLRHDEHLAMGPNNSISRSDLAAFMLDLATSEDYLHRSPMVCEAT